VELVDRRKEARWLYAHYLVSQRRVCGLMVLAESSCRYVSRCNDEPLRLRLLEAARAQPRWGYRRLQIVLDQTGEHVNHKLIYRVYREAGLLIRRKARKRLLRAGAPRPALTGPNQEWCAERKIELVHIEPGKPVQNAHVESFHGKLRDECLNASWFQNLFDARRTMISLL
jgi:hypothetical protein